MRNKRKIMMLVLFVVFFVGAVNHNTIVSNAQTEFRKDIVRTNVEEYRKKYIKMKIVSVSKKKIKIKIENTGDKACYYADHRNKFTLKKYERGKWKKMKFEKSVKTCKCVPLLRPNTSRTITIKWKDYYKNKLKKGKYKFIWPTIGTEKFKVK